MIVRATSNGRDLKPEYLGDQPPFDDAAEIIVRMIRQNNSIWIWCAKGVHMNHVPKLKHEKEAGEILCTECGMVFKSGTYGQK